MASYFNVPKFDDKRARYDMHEFKGRSWHFYRATNPMLLFETDQTIALHKAKIAEFTKLKEANGGSRNYDKFRSQVAHSDTDLWYSRSVIEGCVHPATKANIFPLFRFCAFAPLNLVIVPIMLAPSTIKSKWRTLGIHVVNQSVNAVVNYANRSSDDVSMEKLLGAYSAAVISSCSLALAASKIMNSITDANSFKGTLVRSTLPFAAVVAAGFCNLALMRSDEWFGKGVPLRAAVGPLDDPENDDNAGELLGYSTAAGKLSLAYCSASRVMLNFWVMMVPPLVLGALIKRSATLTKSPFLARQVETIVVGAVVLGAIPPALALMKPVVTTPVVELEKNFQNLNDKNGRPIEYVTFYKGL